MFTPKDNRQPWCIPLLLSCALTRLTRSDRVASALAGSPVPHRSDRLDATIAHRPLQSSVPLQPRLLPAIFGRDQEGSNFAPGAANRLPAWLNKWSEQANSARTRLRSLKRSIVFSLNPPSKSRLACDRNDRSLCHKNPVWLLMWKVRPAKGPYGQRTRLSLNSLPPPVSNRRGTQYAHGCF